MHACVTSCRTVQCNYSGWQVELHVEDGPLANEEPSLATIEYRGTVTNGEGANGVFTEYTLVYYFLYRCVMRWKGNGEAEDEASFVPRHDGSMF